MSQPPLKIPFSQRREREFLYLFEVDAVIAALSQTRSPIRNQALALLLFCQALQPIELCWLRWCDVNFAEKTLLVTRNRSKSTRYQPQQIVVNLQLLCFREIDIMQQLQEQRTTDWVFASERRKRLSQRSLHYIIQHAGALAKLPLTIHPYMLRRSGLFYRSALKMQSAGLSLRQSCLLWNWLGTKAKFSPQESQEYLALSQLQDEAFLAALKQLQLFTGIQEYENLIDYLLGAYSLFPRLQGIPADYWLTPPGWCI